MPINSHHAGMTARTLRTHTGGGARAQAHVIELVCDKSAELLPQLALQ
jgi:hypothetical protein